MQHDENLKARRANWLNRKWKVSAKDNYYLRVDGFVVIVFPNDWGSDWGVTVIDKITGRKVTNKLPLNYATEQDAKLAAFDCMENMKAKWPRPIPSPTAA
jgi:hypothetical protein